MEQTTNETKRRAYTAKQRLLLLGAFLIGGVFVHVSDVESEAALGVFWLVALGVFAAFHADALKDSLDTWLLGIPAVLLCALSMTDYQNRAIADWWFLSIPAVMMTFAVLTTQGFPKGREGLVAKDVLRSVFIRPFAGIPAFFGAIGSLFAGRRASTSRRIGLGLLVGLPLAATVLSLLSDADANMAQLLKGIFGSIRFEQLLWRIVVIFVLAMLFYALFDQLARGKRRDLPAPVQKSWSLAAPAVVIGMLLICYAVFICVQFGYLYSKTLPVTLTYSAYAREGFWQLIIVSIINFTVLGVCFVKAVPSKAMRALETLLLFFTLLLLFSALWRLLLYIGAYGLTIRRILPLWLMAYLLYLVCASALRVFRQNTLLLRVSAYTLVYWYALLSAVPWDAFIAAFNAGRG